MTFRELQKDQVEWTRHNFGNRESWQPLLGLVEEVGEIAHSYLKRHQGIRIEEDHFDKIRDGIGDVVIFLADFSTAMGIDFQDCVIETWSKVKKRDWKRNPKTGE